MADCLIPSAVRMVARRSRSARICFSIESCTERGGSMALSSTRLTRMPHLPVASSRTPRSCALIWSRLVRVCSRSREQLTVTTLRNVIGSLDLEQTLTSRDQINAQLRGVLDEATGKWGIRVNRVELKAIDPPRSVQDSMEKQMRAERDRRATILTAEGIKQSAILTAEGDKQSQILRAEGSAQARILEAQGQSRAITQVFEAIHRGKPDQKLLAYQYLQVLPQLARGDANKLWIIPSELTEALKGIGTALGGKDTEDPGDKWVDTGEVLPTAFDDTVLEDPAQALAEARGQAAL